jgi:Cytochrome domain of cellobiose dehydrogenase
MLTGTPTGSTVHAAISQKCLGDGKVCFSYNIPDATSQAGSGDVYYQITAPSSYGWVAVGTGDQMAGSTMLIIYATSDGNNVTLSPRTGAGEILPNFDSGIKATLVGGSGIDNGVMTANIQCKYLSNLRFAS